MDKSKYVKTTEYDKMLFSLIPQLDRCSYLQGTEGRVFFVDDKYVVKQYFSKDEDVKLFDCFCKEIKGFSDAGLAVPKIYSWMAVPEVKNNKTNLFVLQERVKGSVLFDANMSSIYDRCKDFCNQPDFDKAIYFSGESMSNYQELFSLIVREYIKCYIERNEQLLNVSETELEHFIKSDFEILRDSRYSLPDVQASNIIFDGKKLTMIDNAFLGNGPISEDTLEQVKTMIVRDMFFIFYENGSVRDIKTFTPIYLDEICSLKKQNADIAFETMRRFVKKATEMLDFRKLSGFDFDVCFGISQQVLGVKLANEICNEIEKQ